MQVVEGQNEHQNKSDFKKAIRLNWQVLFNMKGNIFANLQLA